MGGITETKGFKQFGDAIDVAYKISNEILQEFVQNFEKGELDEFEQGSYLARALKRQSEEGSDVSVQEVLDLVFAGLHAAIDTTSCSLNWTLIHLALNPSVQEKLSTECTGALDAHVAELEYLNAFLREQHRMTPVVCAAVCSACR